MTFTLRRPPPPCSPLRPLLLPASPLDRQQDGHRKSGTNAHRPSLICFCLFFFPPASYAQFVCACWARCSGVFVSCFRGGPPGIHFCICLLVKHLCVGPQHSGTTNISQLKNQAKKIIQKITSQRNMTVAVYFIRK